MTDGVTPAGLTETHDAAFGAGKGWPPADFARYLHDPTVSIFGDDACFAVIRRIGPEAEVLTLATHPRVQGQGRAKAMLASALATMAKARIEDVFLEVSDTNFAASALYRGLGFTAYATRANYYKDGSGAICMKRRLDPTSDASF
ncbi:GNAT family N-acetyltransferase [Pseudooctadecabacter jejudonensis]|uniref:Ribosomal-protein-alanine N-acetyltransferase n=1 Tax=Pseudooctadecabacter jejudonensis TaxID=1391910 RepID=A0A1Y5RVI5_9RHOB|nr:N-acetyltransferase [Pseudooctadecabacter jejudonensis]SLN26029.1 ribosomal-protein-alanine N-acetyltransferase [Pseudooctadecabacter jejudonensis]